MARDIETHWEVVECFGTTTDCPLANGCRLAPILREALESFWRVLDGYTVADIARIRGAESPLTFHPTAPESPIAGQSEETAKPA